MNDGFFNFDAVLKIEKKKSYEEGQKYELMRIYQKMNEFIDTYCKIYDVASIDAYCDAMIEFEDWLKNRVNEYKKGGK